jgi:hypothetical protein
VIFCQNWKKMTVSEIGDVVIPSLHFFSVDSFMTFLQGIQKIYSKRLSAKNSFSGSKSLQKNDLGAI